MTTDELRQLLDYDAWANAQVFAAAEALSEAQLTTTVASSFPSVGKTLSHIVAAEWVWLRRWRGESPREAPRWTTESRLPELKSQLASVEAERSAYFADMTDEDLQQVVAYQTLDGQSHSNALDDLVRHVVNHSSYHRGQLATQLRQLGQTPPSTDLITYLRRV
jgi:uncharacterized damage-inducible protein DinB